MTQVTAPTIPATTIAATMPPMIAPESSATGAICSTYTDGVAVADVVGVPDTAGVLDADAPNVSDDVADTDTVGLGDLMVKVGEDWEVQREFVAKGRLAQLVVRAHPPDQRTSLLQRRLGVAELAGLNGAARGVVLRVEVDDEPLAASCGSAVVAPVRVAQGECGGLHSNDRERLKCTHTPSIASATARTIDTRKPPTLRVTMKRSARPKRDGL